MTPDLEAARPAGVLCTMTDRVIPPSQQLRIVVADPDPAAQAFYRDALPALGHFPPCPAASTAQLLELCRAVGPDLVIVDAALEDGPAAACRDGAVPVVLTAADPAAAADGPALVVLAKPLCRNALAVALAAAVRCFARVRAARVEADGLRQQLEERKVIERAKGLVVRYCGLGEDEAYRQLRMLATRGGRKVVEVAREVLAAAEVFDRLGEESPHAGPPRMPRIDRPHPPGAGAGRRSTEANHRPLPSPGV
jgi:AmiR/NasT family two-component response regulator